jgi:hypothetical protein
MLHGFRKTVLQLHKHVQLNLDRIGLRLGFGIQKSIELGAPVGILSRHCDNRQICRGILVAPPRADALPLYLMPCRLQRLPQRQSFHGDFWLIKRVRVQEHT